MILLHKLHLLIVISDPKFQIISTKMHELDEKEIKNEVPSPPEGFNVSKPGVGIVNFNYPHEHRRQFSLRMELRKSQLPAMGALWSL